MIWILIVTLFLSEICSPICAKSVKILTDDNSGMAKRGRNLLTDQYMEIRQTETIHSPINWFQRQPGNEYRYVLDDVSDDEDSAVLAGLKRQRLILADLTTPYRTYVQYRSSPISMSQHEPSPNYLRSNLPFEMSQFEPQVGRGENIITRVRTIYPRGFLDSIYGWFGFGKGKGQKKAETNPKVKEPAKISSPSKISNLLPASAPAELNSIATSAPQHVVQESLKPTTVAVDVKPLLIPTTVAADVKPLSTPTTVAADVKPILTPTSSEPKKAAAAPSEDPTAKDVVEPSEPKKAATAPSEDPTAKDVVEPSEPKKAATAPSEDPTAKDVVEPSVTETPKPPVLPPSPSSPDS